MDNNFINIKAEALTDDTMKAKYTGNVRNFNQLISLGGALIQTFLESAAEMVQQNTDEVVPKDFIKLTIFDALINKLENILNIQDTQENEDAVDSFLQEILKGMNK